MGCLDEAIIIAFLGGVLDAAAVDAVELELDTCEPCRQLMAAVARDWHAQQPHEMHNLASGTTIGRYQLAQPLGAGAMGVVYQAFDPVVDRQVALKLLDVHTFTDADVVLREAQAMGRVNHPAVVSVYDAGVTDDYVFVAMELVQGQTLRQQPTRGALTARQWYAMFAHIAEGLAAAHDAGVVHRDFKPENVLVDRQGMAKVTDFGLARVSVPVANLTFAPDAVARTHAAGTPAYMAPEQLAGGSADARSDQYSFAITLFEVLNGRRPFVATNITALRAAMQAPIVEWGNSGGAARTLLTRMLAPQPEARFSTMHDVASALRRLAAPRRWPWLAATVVSVTALATVVLVLAWPERNVANPCAAADAEVITAWTPAQASALQQAYDRVSLPYAALARDNAQRRLDGYAATLRAGYTAACRATHVQHTQSPALLDRRTQCLDRGTAALQATGQLLTNADANVVTHTVEALDQLVDVRNCADIATLADEVPVPSEPNTRRDVAVIRRQLAEADNTLVTATFETGIALATAAAAKAATLGYRPLEAEALWVLGNLQYAASASTSAQATFERAALAAVAGRSRWLEARIRARLAVLCAINWDQPAQSQQQIELGLALVETLQGSDAIKAKFMSAQAALLSLRGDRKGALQLLQSAVAKLPDLDERDRAELDQDLGDAFIANDRMADALPVLQRSADEARRRFGPDHPDFANCLRSLAIAYQASDPAKSVDVMIQAHMIYTKVLPPLHPQLATVKSNLGALLVEFNRTAEALPYLVAARDLETQIMAADHPAHIETLANLGRAYFALGRFADALAVTATLAPVLSKVVEADQSMLPMLALVQALHGASLRALQRFAEARPILETSLATHRAADMLPDEIAPVQFELAQVLWALRPSVHRARVVELLQQAEVALRHSAQASAADAVAAWRTQHKLKPN